MNDLQNKLKKNDSNKYLTVKSYAINWKTDIVKRFAGKA